MSSRVLEIKDEYIVYMFLENESIETDAFIKKLKVVELPTIIVFDKGKEIRRHKGIVETHVITKGVKTREDQESWYPDWLRFW
jgi:hypothetical protein